MGELIGFLVVGCLLISFCRANEREDAQKRRETYNNLNKQAVDEMEKWRR